MKRLLILVGLLLVGVFLWKIKGLSDQVVIKAKDERIRSLENELQSKQKASDKDRELIASYQDQVNDLADKLVAMGYSKEKISQAIGDGDGSKDIFPKDNGFDGQDLGSGFFAYQVFGPLLNIAHVQQPDRIPNKTPWKFGKGNSGITANNSGFLMTDAKNGNSDGAQSTSGQAGFLEFEGSSISQSIDLSPGKYVVIFDWEGRLNYPFNKISVSIDDSTLFVGTPVDSSGFKTVRTKALTIEKAGKHELAFRGLGGPSDFTGDTFIDNVRIRPVTNDSEDDGQKKHPATPPNTF